MGRGWLRGLAASALALIGASCRASTEHEASAALRCDGRAAVASTVQALSTIDCTPSQDTGYRDGTPFAITVVTVDGEKVERDTANAYYVMAQAAELDGVQIRINSGFRTMAEQERLYACYIECNCNNCNLAAEPGYSNHQSGHALDLNTSAAGVLGWLNANGAAFGFEATVPSEDWHWEWWGGGPGGGPCGGAEYAGRSLGVSGQSYPIVSSGPVTVAVGETVTGWVKLENTGTAAWSPGVVWLAPIPRDQPSPFASPSWQSPARISTVGGEVPPGQVGEFALDLTGRAPGQAILSLGWVAEQQTWFADGPRGGGPEDGYFAVDVNVVSGAGDPAVPVGDASVADASVADAAVPDRDRDASASGDDSGAARSDAGNPDAGVGDSSAGCQASPEPRGSSIAALVALLALALVRRRNLAEGTPLTGGAVRISSRDAHRVHAQRPARRLRGRSGIRHARDGRGHHRGASRPGP